MPYDSLELVFYVKTEGGKKKNLCTGGWRESLNSNTRQILKVFCIVLCGAHYGTRDSYMQWTTSPPPSYASDAVVESKYIYLCHLWRWKLTFLKSHWSFPSKLEIEGVLLRAGLVLPLTLWKSFTSIIMSKPSLLQEVVAQDWVLCVWRLPEWPMKWA